MPSNENKGPLEKLTDKLRSLMGQHDPQKIKGALPPRLKFSIWYAMAAITDIYLFATILFLCKSGDDSPTANLNKHIAEGKLVN